MDEVAIPSLSIDENLPIIGHPIDIYKKFIDYVSL